jgi:maltose/moltooligosaccharide transporter
MNDFQFMPKIMKQLAGFNSFLVCAFSMWIYTTQRLHNTFTERQTLHLKRIQWCNQVGEMFANYNLIAAMPPFLLPVLAKYTSQNSPLFISMRWTWSYIHLFHTRTNGFHYGMASNDWCWNLGKYPICSAMLSGSLPSNKMGYYMGVFNFIVIPQLVAASILGF